ncbi:MAG: cation-translocating P-type ATPase [Erysipelotrichales bacterium]|nr:cation-translocating P-type ATPase [Erysipelotrichales bacterium]
MKPYLESSEIVLEEFKSEKSGLTLQEAKIRIDKNGPNELEKIKKKSLLKRFIGHILNPMTIVLLIAATISFIITIYNQGNISEYAEIGIILSVVILNTTLGVFQERKAEKAIEALQEMSGQTAKVRRSGTIDQIPARELVIGDIILIEAGDSVPADIRIIHSASLKVEEAALTGESLPIEKISEKLEGEEISLGDRLNMSYMGSSVVYGRGEGIVIATGMRTEMGKIASIIQSTQEGETPLQKRLSKLSKLLSIFVLMICVVIFLIRLITAQEITAPVVMESFMLAISLAVAAIPEGMAAVVTIVLSIGVTNMAKRNAIIRKLTAVETLGCAQVICSDKTGTLTQNKMTVVDYYGDKELLAKAMALCCDSELKSENEIIGDPTENALIAFALENNLNKNTLNLECPRCAEFPFDSIRKMMTTFHKTKGSITQYTKGAPDEILRLCSHIVINGEKKVISEQFITEINRKNKEFADRALRVLACAYRDWEDLPKGSDSKEIEKEMTFIGLEAMIDPIRPEAIEAINACKASGIKVVMITGDHKETASAIGKELGIIESADQAITGRELDLLSDLEFTEKIEKIFVYARVQPEHKVRIVNMWKEKGMVTAMTGDGVNDAPAIKSADIGIGMGITGTDVTKNVADMVLADDNFVTIVSAVEEGRRIYDNIQKTMQFLLSTNFSEVLVIFIATIIGFTIFQPVHLLFINLITDSLPAIALGMEKAQPDIMERQPRAKNQGLFADGLGFNIIYQGIIIGLLTLTSYFIVNNWHGSAYGITAAFLTLSLCELFHAYTMRSQKDFALFLKPRNKMLFYALIISFLATMAVIYIPVLNDIFSLKPLYLKEFLISLGLAFMVIPIIETVKTIQRKKNRK